MPRRIILLVGLVAAGLLLRLPGMTGSIWHDEAFRTFLVLRPDNARAILLHDVHNPLYNAFMYLWIRVMGDSESSRDKCSVHAGGEGSPEIILGRAEEFAKKTHEWGHPEIGSFFFAVHRHPVRAPRGATLKMGQTSGRKGQWEHP